MVFSVICNSSVALIFLALLGLYSYGDQRRILNSWKRRKGGKFSCVGRWIRSNTSHLGMKVTMILMINAASKEKALSSKDLKLSQHLIASEKLSAELTFEVPALLSL